MKGDSDMIGIYKYQNKINGHIYIGQSVDIKQRQFNHKSSAYNEKAKDYNSQFHQAIRKYGLDAFDFQIIAELTPEEYTPETLNQLEKFFINIAQQYDIDNYNINYENNTVLHVLTQANITGGHTRVVERWVELQKDYKHSCILLNQNDIEVPEILKTNQPIHIVNDERA